MKLIVGLGNPGIEYQFTPHNMGFLAVDRIAEQCGVRVNNRHCRAQTARTRIAGHEVVLAKPETYMNLSGQSVGELVREYQAQPAEDVVLLYDELDLPFGSLRVRPRGRSAGHNGVESVIAALGRRKSRVSGWELDRIIPSAMARSMCCHSSRKRSCRRWTRCWTRRLKR